MSLPIISRGEALKILRNDLRKAALEKHARELNNATPEHRERLLAQIEAELDQEIKRRAIRPGCLRILY